VYILGSIIKLEDRRLEIPVPWWHRASLGLETSTAVSVSVTEAKDNRPGDLLVSVLDTMHWERNIHVCCVADDEPGVIEKALSIVKDWNIALAETITVEGGKRHRVELIIEPRSEQQKQAMMKDSASVIRRLRKSLRHEFAQSDADCFVKNERNICWNQLTEIRNGWVTFKWKEGHQTWRDVINRQLMDLNIADDFEVNRLVISGDTEGRLFRAMIPRKGALLVTIEHADDPGTLFRLTKALREGGVNVLSSLLKRGGATPRNARLVAVCEPTKSLNQQHLRKEIETRLIRLRTDAPELRIEFGFGDGAVGHQVIYSEHLDHVVARVPPTIRARVLELRRSFPQGSLPVFISRRFSTGERGQGYVRKLHEVLASLNCHVVEATIQPGSDRISLTEVSAAMWAAKAGIVLGVEPADRRGEEQDPAFTLNLAHEFGYMQGQGKPLLLLIEDPSRVKDELDNWTNIKGITAPRFSRDYALDDTHNESIRVKVENWYKGIGAIK
jgi:ACT domain-containing protein